MGLADWAVLLAMTLAIGAMSWRPPRHHILLWPAGSILLNIACIVGSRVLTFGPERFGGLFALDECAFTLLTIAATLYLVYKPRLALCCLIGGWLALALVRYVFAFATAMQGRWTSTALVLLRQPSWDLVLLGQAALAAGCFSLAYIALMRTEVFRPVEPDLTSLF